MLKIDSGNRVLRLDPTKIEKIVESYRKDRIADIYYQDSDSAEYTLDKEECERFISKCYPPERCHLRSENHCFWLKQSKKASPRCIRCRLAQVYQLRLGIDLRSGDQGNRPGIGYAAALLIMAGLTGFSIQNSATAWNRIEALKNENTFLKAKLKHGKSIVPTIQTNDIASGQEEGNKQ